MEAIPVATASFNIFNFSAEGRASQFSHIFYTPLFLQQHGLALALHAAHDVSLEHAARGIFRFE